MTRSFWQARARDAHYDFAIVGGGLLGCSVAYWLRRARPNARLVIVERYELAAGASGRNAGFVLQGTAANYAADVERFGRGVARELWQRTLESRDLMFSGV